MDGLGFAAIRTCYTALEKRELVLVEEILTSVVNVGRTDDARTSWDIGQKDGMVHMQSTLLNMFMVHIKVNE